MPDLRQALKDFVATSNSGKYATEQELMSKFPELKGYDIQALKDFVATSNSGKYATEEELFAKFPEFNQGPKVKKKFASESSSEVGSSELPKSPDRKKSFSLPKLNLEDMREQPNVVSRDATFVKMPKIDITKEEGEKKRKQKAAYELKVAKELNAVQLEEKKKQLEEQKEAEKANLGLRTRKDFTANLNKVVNSNFTAKAEEEVIEDLRKNFSKYGLLFEEYMPGEDAVLVRTNDGKKSTIIYFNNKDKAGNVDAANKLKDFISKNSIEENKPQEGDLLSNSLRAQKLRSVGRLNPDGSTSTVKFKMFEENGKFKVIPTLFPKDPKNYSTNPKTWTELPLNEAIKLAKQRGEVFEFTNDKDAKAFTKGSWKDVSPVDVEAQQFYKKKNLDYMSNKKMYDEYVKVRDMVDFIEETKDAKGFKGDLIMNPESKKYPNLIIGGKFRKDIDKLLQDYKKQEAQLRSQVFDSGFMSEGKVQKTREEFDEYLDKRQTKVASEAAKLNAKAKTQAIEADKASINTFGLSIKDLIKYKPKNEQEAQEKNRIIDIYEDSKVTQSYAAKKYENAKTYFDAKVNKQIKGEYEDNWSATWNSVKDAWNNGQAAEQILAFTLGLKDVNSKTDRAEVAKKIVENLTDQSKNTNRVMSRWQQASGFSEALDVFLNDPLELSLTMAATSLSQILPYGMKIVPTATAAGAGTGAAIGLAGGPFAEVTVPGGAITGGTQGFRTGMAATSLAMEYTNSILDVMREKGVDITDPKQVEIALGNQEIWDEGRERGLKRGIPIAVVDYLSAGLAGKVFKPASSIASAGQKVAMQTAERAVFDPLAEATGELAAQVTAGQEIDWKEISAEGLGGLGNNSSNMAINTYRNVKSNTDINIANNLTDINFVGTESASDERISTWANNMQQLGKIDADMNQRIQENVGLRRDAREALSVGTDKNSIKPSVLARTMELMSAKEQLSSSANRRELYSDKIKAINEELKVIADTKELAPEEQSVDLGLTIGTSRKDIGQYMIDGIRYTKEQFLEKTKDMSARRIMRSDISVKNDEEVGNELQNIVNEKLKSQLSAEELAQLQEYEETEGLSNILNETENAVQEQSTTEIPVQSETGISETVAEGISQPKPEVVTEQVTQEEVTEPLKNIENTTKALNLLSEETYNKFSEEINGGNVVSREDMAKAYHRFKQNETNPEFVQSFEDFVSAQTEKTTQEEIKAEPEAVADETIVEPVTAQPEVTQPQTIIEEQVVEPQAVSEENVSQELNEESLPGYDRAMSEVEGIIEKSKKRGVNEAKTADNVMSYVMGSKIYEDATDVQREALVRDVRKRFGLREKSAPSVAKLFGAIKDVKKITMNEKAALKKQIRDVARGARDAVKAFKSASQQLSKDVKQLKAAGKITSDQAANVIRAFSKVNVFSQKSLDRFTNYMTKVFENADYAAKIKQAKSDRSAIKKLSKNKDKNANLRALAFNFTKIDPSLVEDIDTYNDMASRVKEAIKGSSVRGQKLKVAQTVDINEANAYIKKTMEEQEQKIREERIAELQDLMGVDASEFSAEEMLALLETDAKVNKDNEKIVRATIKKAFDVYSAMIKESIKTGKDLFTDEDIEYTSTQKDLIKKFMAMDTDKMDTKDAVEAIDSLINFLANQSTAKMQSVVSKYTGEQNAAKIAKENIFAVPLKKLGLKSFGRLLGEQTTNLNILFEKMFVGFNRAGKVKDAMGLTDLINGKSRAQRQANNIVADYVAEFYKKEANGQKFNTAFNNIERGMTAFAMRNIVGTDEEIQAEFDRRKGLVEQSIEALSRGDEQEREKSLIYQEVYDKILSDSKNVDEVLSKVDPTNLEAVDFWIGQWDNKYDQLYDTALNVYNKVLDKDSSYTPDRFTKMSYDGSSVDLSNDESAFINNTDGVLYKKETGVLMSATRPDALPIDNKTKEVKSYIDLSFDKNNSNSMYDALIDIETAAPIRQIESFMNTSDFRKIFGADADIIRGSYGNKGRIQQYITNIRNKNPYSSDEFSKFMNGLNKVASFGVGQALAGPLQPIKQVVPVALNTLVNTKGDFTLSAMKDQTFMNWLNNSGYAIANRGVEAQADIDSLNKMIEEAADSKGEKLMKKLEELNKFWLKTFLVKPDVWVAINSWKSYYEQSLKEQGIDPKTFDYSKGEVNKKAADYAQRMVDRQQNISDSDMSGSLFTDKNPKSQAMVKIFMPFATFRMNQASRLGADLRTLQYSDVSTKEDRKIAIRSLAGYAVEMATFRVLSAAISIGLASLVANAMGRGEDEEDKKKRRDSLLKGAVTSTLTDVFSPIPVFDKLVQNGMASTLETTQGLLDISEKDRVSLYKEKKQNFIDGLGTFGIAAKRGEELWDMLSMSVTGKYKDDFGKERMISVKDKNALAVVFPVVLAANITGFASPEISTIGRNAVKISKKKGLTEEEQREAFEEIQRIQKMIDEADTPEEKAAAEKELYKKLEPEQFKEESESQKEYINFLKEEGLKDEEKGVIYENLQDLKRYAPDLYEKNFGPESEYYKLTIDDKEAKKELNKLEREAKDEQYGYTPKRKKSKKNKDGTVKRSYKYKRTTRPNDGSSDSEPSTQGSTSKYSYKRKGADGSTTTASGSRKTYY